MRKLSIILGLCFFMQGCVSSTKTFVKIVPRVLAEQKMIDQEGGKAVISHKSSSVAVRPPAGTFLSEGRPMFYISVYNSKEPIVFSDKNIEISIDGKPHRIFSYNELAEEVSQDQGSMAVALNSKFEAQSRQAAEDSYKSSSNPEVFSPSNDANVVGSHSQMGYKVDINSIAQNQSRLNAQKQAREMAMAKQKQQAMAALAEKILRKTTIPADTWHNRYIVIETIPDPEVSHEIKIIITLGSDKHEFLLNLSKV